MCMQYKTVILTLLTYLVALALALKMLAVPEDSYQHGQLMSAVRVKKLRCTVHCLGADSLVFVR